MKVQIFVLINSQIFMGSAAENPPHGLTVITNPVIVVQTREGYAMAPPTQLTKNDKLSIKNDHIVNKLEVLEDVANEYNAKFGNGLVVINKNLDNQIKV